MFPGKGFGHQPCHNHHPQHLHNLDHDHDQEYSEEDIHRAIGICAINSVTLEPRRLFQGPAKGKLMDCEVCLHKVKAVKKS